MRFTPAALIPRFEILPTPEFLRLPDLLYRQSLRVIESTPGYYNGKAWVSLGEAGEKIKVCQVDYATRRYLPMGARPLTVGCLVLSRDGDLLWAKRGDWVLVEPGLWEPGCAGALEDITDPEGAVKAELIEELSLQVEAPDFIGIAEDDLELLLLFKAAVDKTAPRAILPEVEEIRWMKPGGAPGACSDFSAGLSELFFKGEV